MARWFNGQGIGVSNW